MHSVDIPLSFIHTSVNRHSFKVALDIIKLSEASQISMISLICGILKKKDTNELIHKTERLTDPENELMTTKEEKD